VERNFARFALSAGLTKNAYAFTNQIHRDYVRKVGPADVFVPAPGYTAPDCDGLVTAEAGVPLLGKNADCVPVLLYCPEPRVCAFAHAGWRGTAMGIVRNAVCEMKKLGADPGKIIAAVGPSISPCCFLTHTRTARHIICRIAHQC
jgi:YfiH family protein